MSKKLQRLCWRGLLFCVGMSAFLFVMVTIALGIFLVALRAGPVSVNFAKGYIQEKLYNENIAFTLQNKDNRIIFVIPYKNNFSLIGTTEYFSKNKDTWKGTIVFILQPAEEIGFGARQMINAGLFKKIPYPDINLALHVSAQTQSGTVHITPGFAMANVDSVDVTFYGEGGHGAYPHLTKDPIVMSSQFITTVQTIISRNLSPINAGVVTVGSIHGGTKHNIIPNHVDLQITVRSYSDEDRELIISRIKKIAESIAIQNDLPKNLYPIVKLRDEYTPAVFNNPDLAMRAKEILSKELGKDKVFDGPQVMGGEDFGQFGRVEPKIPSLLFWIGAVSQKDYKEFLNNSKKLPSLHSSKFLPDYEKTIDTGISSSIALIEAHLK